VDWSELAHAPVEGCEDSAAYRRQAGWRGADSKCILFHAKGVFHLVVTTRQRQVNARRFKKPFGTKNIRFATPEEVERVLGCRVGSVPPLPLGAPEVPVYADEAILGEEWFHFNPGDPERSFRIRSTSLPPLYSWLENPCLWFREEEDGRFTFLRSLSPPLR
jgi:prolyl-tRNA editing enzyme YbaK/EbsC (Cys-tRNA(Pro) deacylase)